MQDFRRLVAWQKAHSLSVGLCEFAAGLPLRYVRLGDQLMRAAVSIPANLAEGCGRRTNRDRARFFDYSTGSASESEALVLIAHDLHLLPTEQAAAFCSSIQEARALTHSLVQKVRAGGTAPEPSVRRGRNAKRP